MRIAFYKPLVREKLLLDSMRSQYLGFSMMRAYLKSNEPDTDVQVAFTRDGVMELRPDLVGISSVSEMWPRALEALSWLRATGFSGPVAMGGPHLTALPETLPASADVAVLGEGEATLLDLVRAYSRGRHPDLSGIPGIAFRDGDGQLRKTARRSFLELDTLPMDLQENPSAIYQISTIRGCPFHCQHCVERPTQGSVRYLGAERLLWLMRERLRLTGNRHFFFQDDTFLAAPKRLEELHELMRRQELLGRFVIHSVSLNANLVREETMLLLKEIGVNGLGMGCESFNPRILSEMKRGVIKPEHLARTIEWAGKAGLPIGGSQVYGYPGETREELRDSIARVKNFERTTAFRHWVCYVCQPLPGSELWERGLADGQISLDMDFSTLRIDGDYQHFHSSWHYMNEAHVPREEFMDILEEQGQLAPGFFRPPREPRTVTRSRWRMLKAAVRGAFGAMGYEIHRRR